MMSDTETPPIEADSGKIVWKTYTVEESKPRDKNKAGVQMWGPAGGGIWSSPTVDPQRGFVWGDPAAADDQPKQTVAVDPMDQAIVVYAWARLMKSRRSTSPPAMRLPRMGGGIGR